jgi:hypothetical protein
MYILFYGETTSILYKIDYDINIKAKSQNIKHFNIKLKLKDELNSAN